MLQESGSQPVTQLLAAWSRGDRGAFDRLVPLVMDELRRIARVELSRERAGHTLQPTALINELYLRWSQQTGFGWRDRAHFFALAAAQLRHILVDHARKRKAAKRGKGETAVRLTDVRDHRSRSSSHAVDLIDLDQALTRLQQMDPQCSRIVELRYFAGLSAREVADVLGVTERTVLRRWAWARAWLLEQLRAEEGEGRPGPLR